MPFPTGEGLRGSSGLQRGYFVSRDSANPRACWEWIKFLTEQPGASSGVPARRSVAESSAWETKIGEATANIYRFAVQQINQSETRTNFPEGPLLAWRREAIAAVLQGEDPELALMEAQRKAEAYLSCINAHDISTLTYVEIDHVSNSCSEEVEQSEK